MGAFPSPHIGTFRIFKRAIVTQGNAGANLRLSLPLFFCAVRRHATPCLLVSCDCNLICIKAHMQKEAYLNPMQEILTAISDPTRRAALAILWDGGEHCVCELMETLDASQSRMSRHMKTLRQAGLVVDRRDAQWVRYRRNPDLAPEFTAVIDAVLSAERKLERKVA